MYVIHFFQQQLRQFHCNLKKYIYLAFILFFKDFVKIEIKNWRRIEYKVIDISFAVFCWYDNILHMGDGNCRQENGNG